MRVKIEIDCNTLATLIAGLYVTYTHINIDAVPPSMFIEIAERLVPYLEKWDYNKINFEEWIRTSLIIAPINMFNEIELNEFRQNEFYIERRLGNVTLIATGGELDEFL